MKGRVAWLTVAAGCLWMLSVSLLVMETITALSPRLSAWSIMIGLWACVCTGWALLLGERHRLETIAEMVRAADRDREGIRSV